MNIKGEGHRIADITAAMSELGAALPRSPVTAAPAAVADTPSTGPILSYNVPQQVSYGLQNYIEIELDETYFLAQAVVGPEEKAS